MGKKVHLLALASAVSVITMLLGGAAALADSGGGGYRQIGNLTGPNIPFFTAPPGSLVGDIIFVDPALHRVYLADDSNVKPGTHGHVEGAVDAWDTRTGKFVGAMFDGFTGLAGFPAAFDRLGPDGVLVDNLGHLWAGNGNSTVVVGNARTMRVITEIKTGGKRRADELAYDPKTQTILVTNPGDSPSFYTLIDARTLKILGRATLGPHVPTSSLEQPQFDPLLGKFVAAVGQLSKNDARGAVAVINPQVTPGTHTVAAKAYPLSANCNPAGLAVGPGSDLFLGCSTVGPLIEHVSLSPVGFQVDQQYSQACCNDQVWYDPHLGRYYAAAFLNPNMTGKDPVVVVVDAKSESFITKILVFTAGAPDMSFHQVAADPATGHVYVPSGTGVRVLATTPAAATVPSAPTGEPWSGWLYWVLAAGTGALGYGLFEVGRRRRKARRTA